MRKVIKTGYGLGLLTLRQGKKAASVVKRELHLNPKESVALARELVHTSRKASSQVLGVAAQNFNRALLKTGLVKKRELASAKARIRKRLSQKLHPKDRLVDRIKKKIRRR